MRVVIFFFCFLYGCISKDSVWLNRFEVCCKIDVEVFRDGKKLEFKDSFFVDDNLKIYTEYDVLKGIKIKIVSLFNDLLRIDWNSAVYVDEYGYERKVVLEESVYGGRENVSVIPPYIEFDITLFPRDFFYIKNGIWYKKIMLDAKIHPDKLKGRKVSLSFSALCSNNFYHYQVFFYINPRYPWGYNM